MITTNQSVGAWGEILGDTTVAAAMIDRLLRRPIVFTFSTAIQNMTGLPAVSLPAASLPEGMPFGL